MDREREAASQAAALGTSEMEEARAIALERLFEVRERVDQAIGNAASDASLLRLETDLQVIEALAAVAAKQVLRVVEAAGLLREAAYSDPVRDEVGEQRDRHDEGDDSRV